MVVAFGNNFGTNPVIACPNDKVIILKSVFFNCISTEAVNAKEGTAKFGLNVGNDSFSLDAGTFSAPVISGTVYVPFIPPVAITPQIQIGITVESIDKAIDCSLTMRLVTLGKSIIDPKDNLMGMDTLFSEEGVTTR